MSLGRGYKEYEKCEHREKNKRFNIFEISTATIHCLSIHIDKNEENCYIQKEIRKKNCVHFSREGVFFVLCTSV